MLVDTQPATHQHVPASPEVRDEWIDSQLIGVLMDNASMALLAAVLVIPGLIFILWDQVATHLLLGWLGMALVVLYGRFKLVEVYRLRYDSVEGMQRQAFMRRYVWTWGAVGALWALPVEPVAEPAPIVPSTLRLSVMSIWTTDWGVPPPLVPCLAPR